MYHKFTNLMHGLQSFTKKITASNNKKYIRWQARDLRARVQTLHFHGWTRFSSYDEKFINVATKKTIKIRL